jgi:DNA-binding CsgD family transcriptional regulator
MDALGFAFLRLETEGIAGLVAVREDEQRDFFCRAEVLDVGGLEPLAAGQFLRQVREEIGAEVTQRLISETRGNPLALKEVSSLLTPAQLRGTEPLPEWVPLSDRLIRAYTERMAALPVPTQQVLLLAAVDESVTLNVLDAAAAHYGASLKDLAPAEAAGLISAHDHSVRFSHPMVCSAVYQRAAIGDRLDAHRALADALAGDAERDRKVWHLAWATTGPDPQVAAMLEEVTDRTERHGGPQVAAMPLERAAVLTVDPSTRARRLARAAGLNLDGGQKDRASALLAEAESIARDPRVRAEITFSRARLMSETGADADIEPLIQGARGVEHSEPELAAKILSIVELIAWTARDWSVVTRTARHLLHIDLPEDCPYVLRARQMIGVLEGGGSLDTGYLEAADEMLSERYLPWAAWLLPGSMIELAGAEAAAFPVIERCAQRLRAQGAIWDLTTLLCNLGNTTYLLGRWSSSAAYSTEALSLARQTGHGVGASGALAQLARLAALRGEVELCLERADEVLSFESINWLVKSRRSWALALLHLGQGRPEEAFETLATLVPPERWPDRLVNAVIATGDLAEAAVQSGRPDVAARAVDGLERWGGRTPPAWAQVVLHRCRAVLATDPQAAEQHFRTALTVPGGEARVWEHARARLLYGEWLRRRRRKSDARLHLRGALDLFDRLGAEPWSRRARAELRATGETVRRRDPGAIERVTAQELQIARLAAQGMTNRQIGGQLFLSPRTVGTHLYRLFPKLGVASRAELRTIDLDDAVSA